MKLYLYEFADGTNMIIAKTPLTIEEVCVLESLHGECIFIEARWMDTNKADSK